MSSYLTPCAERDIATQPTNPVPSTQVLTSRKHGCPPVPYRAPHQSVFMRQLITVNYAVCFSSMPQAKTMKKTFVAPLQEKFKKKLIELIPKLLILLRWQIGFNFFKRLRKTPLLHSSRKSGVFIIWKLPQAKVSLLKNNSPTAPYQPSHGILVNRKKPFQHAKTCPQTLENATHVFRYVLDGNR